MADQPSPPNTNTSLLHHKSRYCSTLQEAQDEVRRHQAKTGSRYIDSQDVPSFGNTSWSLVEFKLLWEEDEEEKYQGDRLEFDGVPFLLLATKQLLCHYGFNSKKTTTGSSCKSLCCPASVVLKEVIKFPNYKIKSNTMFEKKRASRMIRDDMFRGKLQSERRIYYSVPPADIHLHTVLTRRVQENKGDVNGTLPHCLVCNGRLATSTRTGIPLFTGKVLTSHRQQELTFVLGGILNEPLNKGSTHSSILCSKCFNLIDDIDSLEEQMINKKQVVINRYKRTLSEVTHDGPSSPSVVHPADVAASAAAAASVGDDTADDDYAYDDEDDFDDDDPNFNISAHISKRGPGRGRPPGRPRVRGRGRGGGGGRPNPNKPHIIRTGETRLENTVVKLELDDTLSIEPIHRIKISTPLQTIKKEDIMSDLDSVGDCQDTMVRIEALEAEDGDLEIPLGKDTVSMELQEDVLEVVEEVLEKEVQESKRFSCTHCHKSFQTKAAVRNHVKVHDRSDSFPCEECEKVFSTKYRLKAHLKTHAKRDRPYNCHICNKTFYTRYHLNTHLKSHEGGRNYVCEVCGKALSTQKTLELHILTHTGEKPYQCEICGSTFRQRSNLLTHIKSTHYHEKKYHCELCQRSFVRKRLLEYHINSVHTGHRPYKCEMCNATFVYPHYFRRHVRKHTGDKPHKCHVCEKAFSSRENRNAHMFVHSEKKPYECKVCCAGFMRKPLCVGHLAVHGQISNPEAYITFNSPSVLANNHEVAKVEEEAAQALHAVQLAEEAASPTSALEEQTQIIRDGKVVKITWRPVHIIETDETTRYVIHSTERVPDNNMDHFFAELQGQVVEVRSEDF